MPTLLRIPGISYVTICIVCGFSRKQLHFICHYKPAPLKILMSDRSASRLPIQLLRGRFFGLHETIRQTNHYYRYK